MRPIPKFLLIHSAVLRKKKSENAWGSRAYTDTALKSVRFEPVEKRQYSSSDGLPEADTKMFFDCRNSSPDNVEFETDDVITFGNEDHRIVKVSSFYDEKRLHHFEVYLQ